MSEGVLIAIITTFGGALVGSAMTFFQAIHMNKKKRAEERKDLLDRLDRIEDKLDKHIAENSREQADESRMQILQFGDEVKSGTRHSEESWNAALSNIDKYEKYCADHENYANSKAVGTIAYLKQLYQERLEKNDFL